MAYDYDIVLIGGGPAGYAGAIRAAQLKKRVLCVERDKLGGICLNWGCIPTKALLTNAHLAELIKNHGAQFGFGGQASWDFAQMIRRSRSVAAQLNKGIEGLFRKYKVSSKFGTAKVVAPTRSRSVARPSRPSRSCSRPASGRGRSPGPITTARRSSRTRKP